jgi:molybdopterin/thiamine biosynthesis adenylyltransferase
MKVLVVGLRGVGMETAKNLALQGAGAITVRCCESHITLTKPKA